MKSFRPFLQPRSWLSLGMVLFALGGGASAAPVQHERATFGGGCFWCLEAVFEDLKGVSHVTSGYAGGQTANPTYEQVCTGTTGHAEVIQVEYDPKVLSYHDLMRIFYEMHDPTTLNRQGADRGTQYRSVVFYENEQQKAEAEKVGKEAQKKHHDPIVTQVVPLTKFYPAEGYHQGYYKANTNKPYCSAVIAPKVVKMRKEFASLLK